MTDFIDQTTVSSDQHLDCFPRLRDNVIGARPALVEQGLGLPRQQLEQSSASPAARAMNAYFWLLVSRKAKYSGALGVLEGGFSHACEDMLDGLQTHYQMSPDALRFFSGHVEADREHAQTGRKLIDRLLATEQERAEFIKEVRCAAELYWKGWDAMLQ